MSIPLVSVVMPIYNRAFMLKRVIDAILSQTYPEVELICVDDGSTDESKEILTSYGDRIVSVFQENQGPSGARNRGIEKAHGEIIHFIDSDVIVPPDLIEEHVRHHLKDRRLIVQGQLVRIMDLEDAFREEYSVWHYSRCFFDTANVSVRKEYLTQVSGFDEKTFRKGWEDLDVGLRLMKLGLKVKRLHSKGFVWHYEGEFKLEDIEKFYKDREVEGRAAVQFYRKHPTFSVRMMAMIGPFFFLLDRLLFNESKLKSEAFFEELKKKWKIGRQEKVIATIRLSGYHFYFKGIKKQISEDGFILPKGRKQA